MNEVNFSKKGLNISHTTLSADKVISFIAPFRDELRQEEEFSLQ